MVTENSRFETGCSTIDSLLNGGFKRGQVVQAFGESGVGKSNLVAITAVNAAVKGETVFIITKDPTTFDRISELADARPEPSEEIIRNVLFDSVDNFAEQNERISELEEYGDSIDLVLFDGIGGYYRLERSIDGANTVELESYLSRQITLLRALARRHDAAVFVTNQVYYSPDEEQVKPLGGAGLENWFDVILRVEEFGDNRHLIVVEKHRELDEGQKGWFSIENDGLSPLFP